MGGRDDRAAVVRVAPRPILTLQTLLEAIEHVQRRLRYPASRESCARARGRGLECACVNPQHRGIARMVVARREAVGRPDHLR